MSTSSAKNRVIDYLECFELISDEQFTEQIAKSIEFLGRNTILNVLHNGLNYLVNEENGSKMASKLQSVTTQLKRNYPKPQSKINIMDLFNEDSISILCTFMTINDQIHLKQTCKVSHQIIKRVDITNHDWIGINYDISRDRICSILKNVHPMLFRKAFNKIKINGDTEDLSNYKFGRQIGVWLFILSNLCKNGGMFITPKLSVYNTTTNSLQMGIFMRELTEHLTANDDAKMCKNNVPHSIIVEIQDGLSMTENNIDWYLERIEACFESMRNLLNENNIKRIVIARKYKIFNDKLYNVFIKRAVDVYGPAFNVESKFVASRKGNDYSTIYLTFTKQLLAKYVSRYDSDDDMSGLV